MAADPEETARLRALHRAYAWKVNAAVAAGRADLVDSLCDGYAEEAVRMLTGPADTGAGSGSAPPPPGRWRALLGAARQRPPTDRRNPDHV